MRQRDFITILDQGTFQVAEIQAVTLRGGTLRVYLRNREEPFEFQIQNFNQAASTFEEIVKYLQ